MQIPQSGPIQVPNPSDTRLHFESYQNMAKMLNQMRGMVTGTTREVVNDLCHVKLTSVAIDEISGEEVTWEDSPTDDWVTMTGGRTFDGTEFPYLLPANVNWLPEAGDVVVVYELIEEEDGVSKWVFYPLTKLNNSFFPSIDETDNTLLRIQIGTVFLNEEDKGTDVTDDGGFDIDTDTYLYVKWTIPLSDGTGAQTPTVTTTIQTTSTEPNFIELGASEVTFKWIIGEIASNEYTSWWWGDIRHDFPCTPKYNVDVRGGDAQTVELMAVKDITEVNGDNDFLVIRKIGHKFAFGNLIDIEDGGTSIDQYKFGGKTATRDQNVVTGGSISGNTLTLTVTQLNDEAERGLTKELKTTSQSDISLTLPSSGSGVSVDVITDARLNTSNNDMEVKTRSIDVISAGSESAWTKVTNWATTDCDAASGQTINGGTSS
jgi:hypothetical protein